MKNNKKISIRMRFLAWIMTAVMVCTGLNVTVYAQEISFDDGYALEQQEEQVTDVETTEEIQQNALNDESTSDVDISSEISGDDESTDEADVTVEDVPGEEVATTRDIQQTEEKADEAEIFNDGSEQNAAVLFDDNGESSDTGNERPATATVYFSFSNDDKYADYRYGKIQTPVALQKLTVPYFDLAKYGLEKYYFKSENYSESDKGTDAIKGTAETAYNHVTLLHLLIYATEVLYLDIPEEQAGRGYLYQKGYLNDESTFNIAADASAGSMFIQNIWGLDLNLLYYKNYEYPLASAGWGATADQILIDDGDVITLTHYSYRDFHNNSGAGFNYLTDEMGTQSEITAARCQENVTFQVYRAKAGGNYGTIQTKVQEKLKVYYTPVDGMVDGDVKSWDVLGETNSRGELQVNLNVFENGTYFVAIPGQPGYNTREICSSPGGIYITVTNHNFNEGVVTKKATCKEAGIKTYTCSVCGETRTEEIPKTDKHIFDEGKVIQKATCKNTGEKTYTCTVCGATRTEEIPKTDEHTFDKGTVTKEATCKEAGVKTYTCTVCGATKTETIAKTNDHKYTWKTTAKATVFAPAKQQGKCSVCGKTVARNYGKKLTATIRLNATSIRLQQRRSTDKIKVTMANGDSVKSWTSSNRRIATVNNKGVITAGRQNGTARITVTLKSGKKASLNVIVQSTKVVTTGISGLKSSETLKRGQKLTLKPVMSPITSQEGITYASSNRNIAVVNSKGVITAQRKGSARITVRSGRKSYTVRVTVK